MKRLIISALCVSIFFLGVGALAEGVGARFKSDAKALELIAKARAAIGGDAAIRSVRGVRITGRTTHTVKIEGVETSETGETEIALQLPDKLFKTVKIGDGEGSGPGRVVFDKKVDVVRFSKNGEGDALRVRVPAADGANPQTTKKIVIKKDDGTTQTLTGAEADAWIAANPDVPAKKHVIVRRADGDGAGKGVVPGGEERDVVLVRAGEPHTAVRQNEMLRTTLSLLLSAPEGIDVIYTYGGESDVDGLAVNVVNAAFGGQTFKLFLDRASNLPVAMNYTAVAMPRVMKRTADGGEATKDVILIRKAPGADMPSSEYRVRFTDYRGVGGVQFPHKWTTSRGGNVEEVFDVTTLEVNPPNLAERFDHPILLEKTKHN